MTNIHLPYQHRAFHQTICPKGREQGHPSVQQQPSGFTHELRDEDQAEANIEVAVVGVEAHAVRRPAVCRVVVPRPAADHPVHSFDGCPFSLVYAFCEQKCLLPKRFRICIKCECSKRLDMPLIFFLRPLTLL